MALVRWNCGLDWLLFHWHWRGFVRCVESGWLWLSVVAGAGLT